MRSIVRRIEALEKRLMPAPVTASTRALLVRIEQGRERIRKMRVEQGLPADPDWALPPKKVHTSHGFRFIMDVSEEGRQRGLLRALRDREFLQSGSPATGGD